MDQGAKSGEQVSAVGQFKGNLVKHILKNFVKTFYFYKIVNGSFQFGMNIAPMADSPDSFENELGSNQLINLNEDFKLASFLKKKKEGLPEKIISANIPMGSKTVEFVGGDVTLWIKLLDFDINPLKPIPNPKKNAVKGVISYRKYFRINENIFERLSNNNIDVTGLKMFKKGKSQYMTIDYDYEFNLKTLLPKLKNVTLHFGILKGRGIYKTGLLSRIFFRGPTDKSLKFPALELNGNWRGDVRNHNFDFSLRKISYNTVKDKFKWGGNLTIKPNMGFIESEEEESLKEEIQKILERQSREFIEQLGIDQAGLSGL